MKKQNIMAVCLLLSAFAANGQTITTIAGSASGGYAGDGYAATTAELGSPIGVAVGGTGNVYISDEANFRIRKVNTSGIITTIAGTGTAGFSGDGMAGTAAKISTPYFLTVDAIGNVYFADFGNNRIRKIDTAGIISTIAGNGTAGFSGDSSQATAAELNSPYDVAYDSSGNIYISDEGNNRIRKIGPSGIITTIAGNGVAGFSGDSIAATAAELFDPRGIAVDRSGNVYIADLVNNRIRKVNTAGIITTIAGNGTAGFSGDGSPATAAELSYPTAVKVDSYGNVYFSDQTNQRIRKIDSMGIISTIAGDGTPAFSGDGGPATAAELWFPAGLALDGSGVVFIADENNNRIRKIGNSSVTTTNVKTISNATPIIKASPNPTDGKITVTVSSAIEDYAQLVITNMVGEKVIEVTVATNRPTEVFFDGPRGVYFLSVITAGGKSSEKILK